MFQHTIDRARRLGSPGRVITVAAETHRAELDRQLAGRPIGATLLQPCCRGTAAGAFLALAYIRAFDPWATIVLLPSDHFVRPEEAFLSLVDEAVVAVDRHPERLVLLGVTPDAPQGEYGWIQPGAPLGEGTRALAVEAFVEKPARPLADELMAAGGLWNTLVLAASVETLWSLGWACCPELMRALDSVTLSVGLTGRMPSIETTYGALHPVDLSADVLQRAPGRIAVLEARDLEWSDWGRPERILETLERMGRTPAFPARLARHPVEALQFPRRLTA
jgi:mannose-1-phosphate guanylyltransferase